MRQSAQEMRAKGGAREWGFTVCDRNGLYRGPEATGHPYGVRIDVKCPQGGRPVGLFHTHPLTGNITPSAADIRETRRHRIGHLCIGIPESGRIKCYPVPKR